MSTPGKELIRLDPRTGRFESRTPAAIRDLAWFPRSVTVLADGRFAIPCETHVMTFDYPGLDEASPIAYPGRGNGDRQRNGDSLPDGVKETVTVSSETFRDYGDGRLFAWPSAGGPLFVLNQRCAWEPYLDRFKPTARLMFSALPRRRVLALSEFGKLTEYRGDGSARRVAQLDNFGYQRISDLAPGPDGSGRVFTTTFINSSCQVMDYRTGAGRNIHPCQEHGGQAPCALVLEGKLWLACYGGAEINVFDPERSGEWPENPRPVAHIGEEQMRPTALVTDGRSLWCATHAQYGKLGGALSRIDPRTGACKVWRNLVGDHNLSSLVVDRERACVYAGTDIHADCDSATPAEGPAAVVAFDAQRETVVWVSRPLSEADRLAVIGICRGALLACRGVGSGPRQVAVLLDPGDGRFLERHELNWPAHWTHRELFVGPEGALYVASPDGLFRCDLSADLGECLIEGCVEKPRVRGNDLFFIRGRDLGVVEGLWTTSRT
jgi:hypothetical protein